MKRSLLILSALLISCPLMLWACSRSPQSDTNDPAVTLYTSVDDHLARMIADAFTQETGIRVKILGDTEATKTTGLVSRIEAEMDHPLADVWWSSEPMGTILLDQRGALEPGAMRGFVGDEWPESLRGADWSWIGIAMRARVIAYASDRIERPPTTLAELTNPALSGKVGMARPQFGTTRLHMALLRDRWGEDRFEGWLSAMKLNKLRLYDGNASVVRAIAMGEIDIGLTDNDDVWAGQANGWRVDLVYERVDTAAPWASSGATLIPNTVAIIKDAPHPKLAAQLGAFLVSPKVEEMLYASTTHNSPVNPELRTRGHDDLLALEAIPDYASASSKVREAMDACERVLISP